MSHGSRKKSNMEKEDNPDTKTRKVPLLVLAGGTGLTSQTIK